MYSVPSYVLNVYVKHTKTCAALYTVIGLYIDSLFFLDYPKTDVNRYMPPPMMLVQRALYGGEHGSKQCGHLGFGQSPISALR